MPLGVTNGSKRHPIKKYAKFTKKRLWLWRWLTPNDRWLLMPQPSTSVCPLLGAFSTRNLGLKQLEVFKQSWTIENKTNEGSHTRQVSITTAKSQRRLGSQLRAGPHKTNCCMGVLSIRHGHKKGWSFLVLKRV